MGEQSIMNSADKLPNKDETKDASEALRMSLTRSELIGATTNNTMSNSDRTLQSIAEYKAGRYALVTAEGLSLLPQGVLNGVKHNWDNPGEFGIKMGTAAAMGAGVRFLLPQAGAAKAVVGTLFTYLMVKDAATPVLNAYSQVSDDKSLKNIHNAATNMSNGLGLFAVDMAAGLPVGMAADKLTGLALNKTATGRAFEGWKEDFYNGPNSPLNRLFKGKPGESTMPTMEEKLQSIKNGNPADARLTLDDKLKLIRENMDHEHAAPKNFSPDAEKAFEAYLQHKKWHKQELQSTLDALLGDSKPAAATAEAAPGKLGEAAKAEAGVRKHFEDPGRAAEGAKPGDKTGSDSAPPARPLDKNAQTVGQMSVTMRDISERTSDTAKQIANFKESVQSPLTQTMRTGKPPLDEGHWGNNKSLIELASQIETPEHVKQAGFLLEHHRVANVQMGIPEVMPEIVELNQYSRSVHKNLMDLLTKNGINPENVLRGTNSPIFLIFDSNGAGPYTIPAIKGVTDTAVIVLPREYQSMLGVHVSGVYSHELGHDLIYGDLLRFPDNLRDNVLKQDVVASAMKSKGIADTNVEIPGVGSMKKSDFFTKLLLAEANENTADIFGTAIDPHTPLSLATLLGSLRKPPEGAPAGAPGKLETRSMYGSEFVDPVNNPLGIEVHGIDSWRVKLGAEVLRQLSNNNAKVVEYANQLDALAENLRRPGDNYVWASMDNKGQAISIPIKEWDAIIPGIVKAQLETPLPALNNARLRDVYPDMNTTFPRIDGLADKFATAARKGESTIADFAKSKHAIEDVYSAGLSAWMKALNQNPEAGASGHIAPDVLLERINGISRSLTSQYAHDNFVPAPPQLPKGPFKLSSVVVQPANFIGRNFNQFTDAHPLAKTTFSNWTTKAGVGTGLSLSRNMFDNEKQIADTYKQAQ